MKILLVEDDRTIAAAIRDGLRQENFAVDVEHDGEAGYCTASATLYDLIILDVMLPVMDGLAVAKALRQDTVHTPILMLSAKNQIPDKIVGLENGADDYMGKPFSFQELLARVKALLRRPLAHTGNILQVDTLTLNVVTSEVKRDGKVLQLSAKEFALLEYLMRNKLQVVSKNNLLHHVWDFDADVLPHTVEVSIANLRAKVDKPFGRQLIHTVRGFGYTVKDS